MEGTCGDLHGPGAGCPPWHLALAVSVVAERENVAIIHKEKGMTHAGSSLENLSPFELCLAWHP
eukprot:2266279-Amphidinium_carterae.1